MLYYVDYAAANQLAGVYVVCPDGQVWIRQFYVTGPGYRPTGQQLGELAALASAIFDVTCMWAGDKKIVVGHNNVGALMAALRNHGSGRIKGRAYWLRRLALSMLEYCQDSDGCFVAHLCGSCMPADFVSRMDFIYTEWTLYSTVRCGPCAVRHAWILLEPCGCGVVCCHRVVPFEG